MQNIECVQFDEIVLDASYGLQEEDYGQSMQPIGPSDDGIDRNGADGSIHSPAPILDLKLKHKPAVAAAAKSPSGLSGAENRSMGRPVDRPDERATVGTVSDSTDTAGAAVEQDSWALGSSPVEQVRCAGVGNHVQRFGPGEGFLQPAAAVDAGGSCAGDVGGGAGSQSGVSGSAGSASSGYLLDIKEV
eukprot:SAG11_NODE_11869_length_734_cov_0.886614_1_plen_188_part_01